MANADIPSGFRPHGRILSQNYYVAAGTIYPGDAVKFETGADNTTQMRARVVAGTAGAALCGVALHYAVAGQKVLVCDDPSQLFVGQCDDATIDKNDDLGLNCSILATAGNSTYKVSRMELDASTAAVTATLECKIIGVIEQEDGKNTLGEFTKVIFKINNHQLSAGTGTLAI